MRRQLTLLVLLTLTSTLLFGAKPKKDTGDRVPLDQVIKQVQAALDEYQQNLGGGKSALPPLANAEFDFKTTTGTTVSGGFTILIFKFGVSHEKDTVNDVTYSYAPNPPKTQGAQLTSSEPPSLTDELAKTIQEAAKTITTASTAAGLPFNQLVVNLQYGVKWDVNASGSPQISFVTINLGGDKNKNTVQSVKLTWKVPPPTEHPLP
jgi:hypothetical protein